ncbi:LysR family transcriptional regulator [Endozoicomonas euniceicola]|uniref:LysR family transcriptional regulator n=1 Tax=Endozoicomonas euniceicola TaxID=1234143 RepID=A0ABY6GWG7_9GAMM|nr:LysR family transcriptional regulator [Endozoicomonas euniceicola]UYM17108.1 LysR family transcriptional regulator [Endozoicomonas euniceicola]
MANWEGIREFVAVTETESFTLASKRLGLSIAQVSRQVSALEQRLATKLFYRSTRRVTVTEAGQLFYNHCRPLLDGLDEAEAVLTSLQTHPRGSIKVTAPVTFGEKYIAPVVNAYCYEFPDINVELNLTNLRVDLIENGIDLAIRLGQLDSSNMIARQLGVRSQHLCASPEYLKQFGSPETLNDLEGHNCLMGRTDYWRFEENNQTRNLKVTGSLRCNSGNALLDAALKALGLVQLPNHYVAPAIQSGELVELLADYQPPAEGIWVLYPHNRHLSTKVSLLIERINQKLQKTDMTTKVRAPGEGPDL